MQVLILIQENCAACDHAKQILRRLSAEYPLSLSMLDIGSPEGEALAARAGIFFPPGVLIDGEPFSYGGLSEQGLRKEIQHRLARAKGRR